MNCFMHTLVPMRTGQGLYHITYKSLASALAVAFHHTLGVKAGEDGSVV